MAQDESSKNPLPPEWQQGLVDKMFAPTLQTESQIRDKCRADWMHWQEAESIKKQAEAYADMTYAQAYDKAAEMSNKVTVVLDWDCGPAPHFFEKTVETTLSGRGVALVPAEIWARYKRLRAEVFDLEEVIIELLVA